jgi:hypothetical protein
MTMLQDEIGREGEKMTYQSRPRTHEKARPGAAERIANLKWARDQCDGFVKRGIMAQVQQRLR